TCALPIFLIHPGAAVGDIGQLGRDRARCLGSRKLHAQGVALAQKLDAGKHGASRVETLEKTFRYEMRVDIDDELLHGNARLQIEGKTMMCASQSITGFSRSSKLPRSLGA